MDTFDVQSIAIQAPYDRAFRYVADPQRLPDDPARLLFATNAAHARQFPEVLTEIRKLEALRRAAALYRSHPAPIAPEDFAGRLRALLAGEMRRTPGVAPRAVTDPQS
jgi:hypothetical protein